MNFLMYVRNNRIKILKYLISLVVFFFLLSIVFEIFKVLFDDVYNTITLTYILLIVIINFIPEFSPYILNNYLIYLFPFLSKYSGRGAVYILIGLATISPELNNTLNLGGYALIVTGLLCLYMNYLLIKNYKYSNDYDFNLNEKNAEFTFQNSDNNTSGRNSENSDINNNNEKTEKENKDLAEYNMMKLQEALNKPEPNETPQKLEMKDLNN